MILKIGQKQKVMEYMRKEEKCVGSMIPDTYSHIPARAEPERGRATTPLFN